MVTSERYSDRKSGGEYGQPDQGGRAGDETEPQPSPRSGFTAWPEPASRR